MSSHTSTKKSVVKTYFAKKYDKVLDSIQAVEESISGTQPSSTTTRSTTAATVTPISSRALLQKVAGSLVNASIERIRPERDDTLLEFSESLTDQFESKVMSSTFSTKSGRDHFIDIFLDKLIARITPENLPEREHFVHERTAQPVSITILTKNLKSLTGQMDGIFEVQDSIVRLLTWRNPSGTITMLILFTILCYNPMYLILLPLFHVMYGSMARGYMYRHPLRKTIYPARREFGKSLINTVASGGPSMAQQPLTTVDTAESLDPSLTEENDEDRNSIDDRKSLNDLSGSTKIIVNLRDLQDMTTGILSFHKSMEKFNLEVAGFKDEYHSTRLFLKLGLIFIILWSLSTHINWGFLMSSLAWSLMIRFHPKLRNKLSKRSNKDETLAEKDLNSHIGLAPPINSIILDEKPEVRFIEIFELYQRGVIPRYWRFLKFSNKVFEPADQLRKAQQQPLGVLDITEVLPPLRWEFDENSNWEIDHDVSKWASQRGLETEMEIEGDFLIDPLFKRRRLIRKVVKYANPIPLPAHD
ncbi:hypothetical protein NCAS_0D01550 [Naumovozyma castellii]|uniref:TECPR1-like DysF domain-containing protein n=1 Tax=Naumovozyma castellii TaxID=27288 RepID=G0VDU7_NAUCA|nr:hypothetical protein NCAS_0D01550 [Naumovozyma castellii CBS 4309]CCC69736.1 hypothetical protein NCAS_0D01550 [Naumovozyma castellii CBS 4309]